VWSWRGLERSVYYELYVVLDIFSRCVVGWTVAAGEDAEIAKALLEQAMTVHGPPGSVHAERGTSMTYDLLRVEDLVLGLDVPGAQDRPLPGWCLQASCSSTELLAAGRIRAELLRAALPARPRPALPPLTCPGPPCRWLPGRRRASRSYR
jgi:hypothetical protein